MIFESPDNRYPTVEELVLCDLFRNIDLREMRGPSISVSFILSLSWNEEERKKAFAFLLTDKILLISTSYGFFLL